jgi:hypothetical protein
MDRPGEGRIFPASATRHEAAPDDAAAEAAA